MLGLSPSTSKKASSSSASGSGSSTSRRSRGHGDDASMSDVIALQDFSTQQQPPQQDGENRKTAETATTVSPEQTVVEINDLDVLQGPATPARPIAFPPAAYTRSHGKSISILNDRQGQRQATPIGAITTFAPLPESTRKQPSNKDAAVALSQHRDLLTPQRVGRANNALRGNGRPSSSDSLPLQRVASHGRDSVMEMDLADAAMEPMSAHDMAAGSMHEQARRRRQHRRRHRHRTPSIASRQTKRTVRSRAGKAIRRRIRRRRDSSSSSSSSSSGSSSSSSSSSGIDWRFWRSSTASSDSNDSYIPPEPTFTLYTPRLDSPLNFKTYSDNDLAKMGKRSSVVPHPYTSRSAETREKSGPEEAKGPSDPLGPESDVFHITLSRTLNPCLDKLKEFWQERDQQEGAGGDLGAAYLAVPKLARGRPSSRTPNASRPNSRKASPDPSHPATSRRLRGTGAAWWLDVQCASTADMRMLRRLIPMHPLTIEDILAQETREKIESYEQLGYYFVAFRALDETYFRYSENASSSSTSSLGKVSSSSSSNAPSRVKDKGDGNLSPSIDEKGSGRSAEEGTGPALTNKKRRGIVEIVEGHKEGVEGAGVGAVNMYLVVFGDGIISFHFEDISKHANRVKERLTQFGRARDISSHWIAYGLMDSIVDTFFPLINFIEAEADDIDGFLANPLRVPEASTALSLGFGTEKRLAPMHFLAKRLRPIVHKMQYSRVARFFGVIRSSAVTTQREADFSRFGEKRSKEASIGPKSLSHKALQGVDKKLYSRAATLRRIAVSRKLIQGLSRLLIPKNDVVRGLRKRLREERSVLGIDEPGQRHDIGIYLGDLQDHIITMQQTLNFFDTMLSHDHPAYLGLLRLAYEAAKMGNDKAIVRLNIILVMFLPINIYTTLWGSNVYIPHNTLLPNGRPAALWAFGLVVVGLAVPIGLVISYAYWAISSTRKAYATRKGVARRL